MTNLSDTFGRTFHYLRLSVTDICNFRCSYCLPTGCKVTNKDFLDINEIRRLVNTFSSLGIKKIRLTGGEPTTRKNFTEIASMISRLPMVNKLTFTTNGYQLKRRAQEFLSAGITSANVSIDSLDPAKFHTITGHDRLYNILDGIETALNVGFSNVKINTMLLRGVNDNEIKKFLDLAKDKPIDVRFLELMQTGENREYFKRYHLDTTNLQQRLIASGWVQQPRKFDAGPAIVMGHPEYQGKVGLIAPYSPDFCQTCNRLRVSAHGKLHPCLFSDINYDLRRWLQSDEQATELTQQIQNTLQHKKISHFLHQGKSGMIQHLSQIGG